MSRRSCSCAPASAAREAHSCRPDAEAFTYGRRVWIYSKGTIQAGEQITIDYGEEYLNAHMKPSGCKCAVCAAGARPVHA
jgi:uncharacterized protein